MIRRMRVLAVLACTFLASLVRAGDDPPPGPPWVRSYAAAKQAALEKGIPIFVYFTKTY